MNEVRLATQDDVDAIVSTVVDAFADDPAWAFIVGDDPEHRLAFARTLLLPRLALGTVWIVGDADAVAMWDRRGLTDPPDPLRDAAWRDYRGAVGEIAWEQLEAYEDALGPLAPARPHWYLGVLATHPRAQGRGLATAVLQPGFSAAASDGWDCWLETSTTGNKAFYERRGFTGSRPITAPGFPPTWWLQRPHQA
ncbi:MAG: GNAT family N-acetyltransferase [Solirubrobacteraceae bacterium]|nr:GNAT family N-acetyltransferase [Solirubrobacteraceae bacterium]